MNFLCMRKTKRILSTRMSEEIKATSFNLQNEWTVDTPPKVGVIITHYNYSRFIEKALASVLGQSYPNYELIVVDDCSDSDHFDQLQEIVGRKNNKVQLIRNERNKGQLLSFYAGVEKIDAEFYCLLDPDDHYLESFLEELIYIHLNPYIYVPMVCCNQLIFRDGQQIGGTLLREKKSQPIRNVKFNKTANYHIQHYEDSEVYWPWTSTSSMMFRRDALKLLFSENLSAFRRQADSYLSRGCQMLGGSLVYDKALVGRGFHENNSARTQHLIALNEIRTKTDMPGHISRQKEYAFINILNNDGLNYFGRKHFKKILKTQFSLKELIRIRKSGKNAKKLCSFSRLMKMILSNPALLFRY